MKYSTNKKKKKSRKLLYTLLFISLLFSLFIFLFKQQNDRILVDSEVRTFIFLGYNKDSFTFQDFDNLEADFIKINILDKSFSDDLIIKNKYTFFTYHYGYKDSIFKPLYLIKDDLFNNKLQETTTKRLFLD